MGSDPGCRREPAARRFRQEVPREGRRLPRPVPPRGVQGPARQNTQPGRGTPRVGRPPRDSTGADAGGSGALAVRSFAVPALAVLAFEVPVFAVAGVCLARVCVARRGARGGGACRRRCAVDARRSARCDIAGNAAARQRGRIGNRGRRVHSRRISVRNRGRGVRDRWDSARVRNNRVRNNRIRTGDAGVHRHGCGRGDWECGERRFWCRRIVVGWLCVGRPCVGWFKGGRWRVRNRGARAGVSVGIGASGLVRVGGHNVRGDYSRAGNGARRPRVRRGWSDVQGDHAVEGGNREVVGVRAAGGGSIRTGVVGRPVERAGVIRLRCRAGKSQPRSTGDGHQKHAAQGAQVARGAQDAARAGGRCCWIHARTPAPGRLDDCLQGKSAPTGESRAEPKLCADRDTRYPPVPGSAGRGQRASFG